MNRKHTINEYLDVFYKLKEINSKIEFSSDFIIGYPGEEEKDFEELDQSKDVALVLVYGKLLSSKWHWMRRRATRKPAQL